MQVKVKTVLNKTHPIPGFRYAAVRLVDGPGDLEVWGEIEAHAQRRGRCSVCAQAAARWPSAQAVRRCSPQQRQEPPRAASSAATPRWQPQSAATRCRPRPRR